MTDKKTREVRMTHRRKSRKFFDRAAYRKARRSLRPVWDEMRDRYAGGKDARYAVLVPLPEPERPRRAARREEELI